MRSEVLAQGEEASAGGSAAMIWALGGVCLLFSMAVLRLGRRGLETVRDGLSSVEWFALVVLVLLFVVGEGWGALQRKWVPRLMRRARALRAEGSVAYRILAPLYGMSLIGAPPAGLLRAWGGTAAIVAAVWVVRSFPEPWRGITDLAVASALLWGMGAIVRESWRAMAR